MHEKQKINEARYFLNRLASVDLDRDSFIFELSAFLTAARSALQYALLEAKSKQGGQSWYEDAMKKSKILSFFKDARDLNVHEKPTEVRAHVTIAITDTVHVTDSVELIVRDAQGKLISQVKTEPLPPPESTSHSETSVRHFFTDWLGNEDVQALCTAYMHELDALVPDGIRKGFIAG